VLNFFQPPMVSITATTRNQTSNTFECHSRHDVFP